MRCRNLSHQKMPTVTPRSVQRVLQNHCVWAQPENLRRLRVAGGDPVTHVRIFFGIHAEGRKRCRLSQRVALRLHNLDSQVGSRLRKGHFSMLQRMLVNALNEGAGGSLPDYRELQDGSRNPSCVRRSRPVSRKGTTRRGRPADPFRGMCFCRREKPRHTNWAASGTGASLQVRGKPS